MEQYPFENFMQYWQYLVPHQGSKQKVQSPGTPGGALINPAALSGGERSNTGMGADDGTTVFFTSE